MSERTGIVEPLEPRQLLAGVTIITHGFQTSSTMPAWVHTMALAISARDGGADIYCLRITGAPTPTVQSFTKIQSGNGTNAESIIEVDWASSANNLTQNVSADKIGDLILPYLTTYPNTSHPFSELPIHVIGHSRGASVVSWLTRDLAQRGLWVDDMTTLDPHPLTSSDPKLFYTVIDPTVFAYDNVVFADNYHQTETYPTGAAVAGANEVLFPNGSGIGHSGVHTYYHGTIDRAATSDGDGGTVSPTWYTYPGAGPRATVGFDWSREGRGSRPASGISALAGGSAARTHIALSTTDAWPDIGSVSVRGGGAATFIPNGQSLGLNYRYQDVDGASSVSLFLDTDQSPYDGSTFLAADTNLSTTGATPNSAQRQVAYNWNTGALPAGVYYVYAAITSPTAQTRYSYMTQPLFVSAGGAEVITKQFTANLNTNWSDAANWTPGGVPTSSDRVIVPLAADVSSAAAASAMHLLSGTTNWTAVSLFAGDLSLAPGARLKINTPGTLEIAGLVSNSGTIDLAGGVLQLDQGLASPGTITAQLRSGYNAGTWTGAGITSSTAAADAQHLTAIGYVNSGSVYTLKLVDFGDANLDGVVNADDYALIDRGFAMQRTGWTSGDFNYDDAVTIADYLLIDRTNVLLSSSGTADPTPLAERQARFGTAYVSALEASVAPDPVTDPLPHGHRGRPHHSLLIAIDPHGNRLDV